jgi:hypothetical protein
MKRSKLVYLALAMLIGLATLSSAASWADEEPDGSARAVSAGCNDTVPDLYVGDFDGDGRADLGIFWSDDNSFQVALSTGKGFGDEGSGIWVRPGAFGHANGQFLIGDYNGDGRDDLGFLNPDNATFYSFSVKLSDGESFEEEGGGRWLAPGEFGNRNGRYYVAYFNGGKKADLGFFHYADNSFWVSLGTGEPGFDARHSGKWIDPSDEPFGNRNGSYYTGDFNEDGSEDLGFFEPADDSFHVSASDGTDFYADDSGVWIEPGTFGNENGQYFVGDFDGDGDADLGYFNPGDDSFFVARSDKVPPFPPKKRERWIEPGDFGNSNGTFFVADFNGGGKDDLGFYNPSDRTFHVTLSTGYPGFDFTGSGQWASLGRCRAFLPMMRKR